MGFLYLNSEGKPHRSHSYSAGLEYDQCPQKYFLKRVLGYRPKDDKASLHFGRVLETAIQYYHEHEGKGAIAHFEELWNALAKEELKFTKTEQSWANLLRCGKEMIRLYEIRQPLSPIPLNAAFQISYVKEVFPGHEILGEIEQGGKIDIRCLFDPEHPWLKGVRSDFKNQLAEFAIGDIKTSSVDFPDTPGIVAFDKQMRNYAWLTGIYTVFFLWFKKCGHGVVKGSSVTLLEDVELMVAGDEAVVAAPVGDEQLYLVRNDFELEAMEDAQGHKRKDTDTGAATGDLMTDKPAKERKAAWLAQNATLVYKSQITRQRLQFNVGVVSKQSADDAGAIAGRQITQIVNSWRGNSWPNTFGVRFPNDDKNDPYFRAFILGDKKFQEEYFTKTSEAFEAEDEDPEEVTA